MTQPSIVISLVLARIGCNFKDQTRLNNLRWLLNKSRLLTLGFFLVIVLFFYFIAPGLVQWADIETSGSFIIAGIFISCTYILMGYIGLLQSIDRFYIIAWLFLVMSFVVATAGFTVISLKLGILSLYGVLALSTAIALITAIVVVDRILPRTPEQPRFGRKMIVHGLGLTLSTLFVFFILCSTDVIAYKFLFDSSTAGYYARHILFGKITFMIATTIALIIFPKMSKKAHELKTTKIILSKGLRFFFVFSMPL